MAARAAAARPGGPDSVVTAVQELMRGRQPETGRTVVLHLPFVTARLEMAPPPRTRGMKLGPLAIPSPKKTAYYVGLGALAAVEVIEWPIAAAIAAGTYVAQHTRPDGAPRNGGRRAPST